MGAAGGTVDILSNLGFRGNQTDELVLDGGTLLNENGNLTWEGIDLSSGNGAVEPHLQVAMLLTQQHSTLRLLWMIL